MGFAAGLPGLFGRNMVQYAAQVRDRNQEEVYSIQTNVAAVLGHAASATCRHVLLGPVHALTNYFQFYFYGLADKKRWVKL